MNKQIDQFDISAENEGLSIRLANQYRPRKILRKSKIVMAKKLYIPIDKVM